MKIKDLNALINFISKEVTHEKFSMADMKKTEWLEVLRLAKLGIKIETALNMRKKK